MTLSQSDIATLGGDVIWGENIPWGIVVTRLHLRYDKDEVGEDLIFREADPILGGREFVVNQETGEIEKGAQPGSVNNFQARYIIRHAWDGPVECTEPIYKRWGGPEGGAPSVASAPGPNTTGDDIFETSDLELEELVREDIPELNIVSKTPMPSGSKAEGGGCTAASPQNIIPAFLFLGVVGLIVRRRK